ncbi:hypothetical protein BURPS305_0313 [Burkholderia pseudomallei 305]|nr:hypothetical protein BURPS305_0313 [Burkholderia pseudomallei 305]
MMNSDAFFPFSDMFVTFEQVTDRAFFAASATGVERRFGTGAVPPLHSRGTAAHDYGAVQRKAAGGRPRRSRV